MALSFALKLWLGVLTIATADLETVGSCQHLTSNKLYISLHYKV